MRFARDVLSALFVVASVVVGAPSTWLLVQAQSWTGRALAGLGFAAIILPVAATLARRPEKRHGLWHAVTIVTAVGALALLATILQNVPSGIVPPQSPVRHHFTTPTQFPRYSPANIVPEIEQINLGFLLMPYLDPILTRQQASRVSEFTLELYREMEREADFQRLGSAMRFSYAGLLGQSPDAGHYYLYVPRNRGEGPLPAFVFLHGSAGNFKAYTWLWSKLAEEEGMIVIAPSFGFGNWRRPGGAASVLRALDDAATLVEIDEERVFLAGLSNGGLGVSQLAAQAPDRFAGLIFLSPVMDTRVLESGAFLQGWQSRPVLVLTGEDDRRIPYEYVQRHARLLAKAGVRVTEIAYPGEDHFLIFSRPEQVIQDVSEWLSPND